MSSETSERVSSDDDLPLGWHNHSEGNEPFPGCPACESGQVSELQSFLVTQINGWRASGHPPERLARLVELVVRQEVERERETFPETLQLGLDKVDGSE